MVNKTKVFSRFNLQPVLDCSVGSPTRMTYVERIGDNGVREVVESGKEEDLQAYIDSFKDDCDIYKILDRLSIAERSPEVVLEALQQFRPDMFTEGKYGDFSDLPTNIHEVSKFYRDSVEFFEKLPGDVKAKYHYSVDEFFANFDGFLKEYGSASAPSAATVDVDIKEGSEVE